jgi:glycosyltransferase involved in cell wall biosynthesis
MEIHSLPQVSVIITAYNAEKYISESIQSVIDQKYLNVKIIVVDDGSTDKTENIIKQFSEEIAYYYQEHSGIATGWNNGVKKASGKYISFIDADDTWKEGKLNFQVQYLENHPGIDIVFGYAQEFYQMGKDQRRKEPIPGISAGTMMIRKDRFLDVGYFNPEWRKGIFSDWYLRAMEAGLNIYMDKSVMLRRRIHDSNHGITQRDKYVDYVRMLKASLDRKRNKE